MTLEEVARLHPGDEVHWEDPDEGMCSKTGNVVYVSMNTDNSVVVVLFTDGTYLECFPSELR